MPGNDDDDEDDAWDAFGSDSDDSDNDRFEDDESQIIGAAAANAVAIHLSQAFLKSNPQVALSEREVGIAALDGRGESSSRNPEHNNITESGFQNLQNALRIKGMLVHDINRKGEIVKTDQSTDQTGNYVLDAMIVLDGNCDLEMILPNLLPGGILVYVGSLKDTVAGLGTNNNHGVNVDVGDPIVIAKAKSEGDGDDNLILSRVKSSVKPHTTICPWLPSSASRIRNEMSMLQDATVALSAWEVRTGTMKDSSNKKAVDCLKDYGYCVIRGLINAEESKKWGQAVIDSVHEAAKILLERDKVDIFHPHSSQFEPQSYRELSMREDLRLDLRHGSRLGELRSQETSPNGNDSVVVRADAKKMEGSFLRGNASLLEIIRQVMNPKSSTHPTLYQGNIGRYNFDGSGPDGSFQDLRLSPVGGIVSLPGAAEQALHADTPHLFEHLVDINLPAHYINIFTPGVPFNPKVGGTAFVHGSHSLAFTAKHCGDVDGDPDDNSRVYPFLVRPCLTLGDVVLFDCRILHFGLANKSDSVRRAILYTNTSHTWFHDPKNWDDRQSIFDQRRNNQER